MCSSVQDIFRAPVKSGAMKPFVLFPNKEGRPELQLALEANDRDSLKPVAHNLAKLRVVFLLQDGRARAMVASSD